MGYGNGNNKTGKMVRGRIRTPVPSSKKIVFMDKDFLVNSNGNGERLRNYLEPYEIKKRGEETVYAYESVAITVSEERLRKAVLVSFRGTSADEVRDSRSKLEQESGVLLEELKDSGE